MIKNNQNTKSKKLNIACQTKDKFKPKEKNDLFLQEKKEEQNLILNLLLIKLKI